MPEQADSEPGAGRRVGPAPTPPERGAGPTLHGPVPRRASGLAVAVRTALTGPARPEQE
jgi:hypothetical protein